MVSRFLDILFGERRPKAGPASARLKLGLRAEESRVAADATEETPLVQIPIGPGKGHLRSSLPGDLKRGTAELLSPSLFAFDDLQNNHDALCGTVVGEFCDPNHLRLSRGCCFRFHGLRSSVVPEHNPGERRRGHADKNSPAHKPEQSTFFPIRSHKSNLPLPVHTRQASPRPDVSGRRTGTINLVESRATGNHSDGCHRNPAT